MLRPTIILRAFARASSTAKAASPAAATVTTTAPHHPDGLPRWPTLTSSSGLLRCADWFGTGVFAVSGSITAASAGMDLFGAVAVGSITALGGGTIRDALFLNKKPFWVDEWEYLLMAGGVAGLTFFLWPSLEGGGDNNAIKTADGGEGDALLYGDAIGVAAFAVIGAQNGIRALCHPAVSALCGVSTATFGGATRDVLCKRDVRILHSEKVQRCEWKLHSKLHNRQHY